MLYLVCNIYDNDVHINDYTCSSFTGRPVYGYIFIDFLKVFLDYFFKFITKDNLKDLVSCGGLRN